MNMKSVVASTLVVHTLGCAITGKECTPPTPASDKAAELIIYRPAKQLAKFYDAPISIDDCIVGMLADGSFISYKVAAGTIKLRAEKRALALGGDTEIRAGIPIGETVYVRFAFVTVTTPIFTVTNKLSAETEMPTLGAVAR